MSEANKQCGILVDNWKLDIFKRHLDAGGFKYTTHPIEGGDEVSLLKVSFYLSEFDKLNAIVRAAYHECEESKIVKH